MNLRSPASGRNVSRVDISIPAPTRCFLPREQDSLSLSLSRPRLVLLLPLAQDESQPPRNTPILYEKARAYTHIRIRTYAQSRVSEREEREHVLFSLSLLLASFSPFLLHPLTLLFLFSSMLHCTLSFSLKNSSLSLRFSFTQYSTYAENRGRGFDRPVNLGLQVGRTEVEGIARAA